MLRHELLQHIVLLLLLARRLPLPLHLLVIHHLLHHPPCLAVQLTQLAVLGLDLLRVDLGRGCHDVGPPVGPAGLDERDGDFFAGGRGGERPGAVVRLDGVREVAL